MPTAPQRLTRGLLSTPAFLILVALAEGEAHGYRIRQQVIERSKRTIKLDPGSLYRLVARLFDENLIEESPGPPARGRSIEDARRRYYRLTQSGRRVLAAETERLASLVDQAREATRRLRHA